MRNAQPDPCRACNGEGTVVCRVCNGKGHFGPVTSFGGRDSVIVCSACNGTGKSLCLSCNGTGELNGLFASVRPLLSDDDLLDGLFPRRMTSLGSLGKVEDINVLSGLSSTGGFGSARDLGKLRKDDPLASAGNTGSIHDLSSSVTSAPSDSGRNPIGQSSTLLSPPSRTPLASQQPNKAATQTTPRGIPIGLVTLGTFLALAVAIWLATQIGFAATLVVAEVFFIFGGWFALRVSKAIGKSNNQVVDDFGAAMAIVAGLCGGALAAFLVLTTEQGYNLVMWVNQSTLTMVMSLFASVFAVSVSEVLLPRITDLFIRK